MLRWMLFISCICCTIASFSQEAWSLQQCIDYALKNNLQIRKSELSAELNREDLLRSKADLLPTLNGFVSHSYSFGRTVDPFTNEFATDRVQSNSFSINSSITLFEGFRKLNAIAQARLNYQSSKYDAAQMQENIVLNIATAYMEILFDKEILKVASDQYEITKQQKERTALLVQAGKLAKGDLLDIEAQLASEELNMTNAQNTLMLAKLKLRQLLYLPNEMTFDIIPPLIHWETQPEIMLTPDAIYDYAVANRPSILSAETRMNASKKNLAIARSGMFPRLTLNGTYGTGYSELRTEINDLQVNGYDTIGITTDGAGVLTPAYTYSSRVIPFFDQLDNNVNRTIGLNLTIPLLNGLASRTSLHKAKIGLESAMLDLEIARDELEQTIQQAYADAISALSKFKGARKQSKALEEAFRYAEKRFNIGMITAVDYNDAKNKLTKSKSDVLQAKYEFLFKSKVLDFYMGKPIEL